MIVQRWQAAVTPSVEQIKMILHSEGLEFSEEKYSPADSVEMHKHPFEEVRIVVHGSLIYNLSGNKLLLRSGDRIEIPPNTRHSTEVHGDDSCISIVAYRPN